MTVLANRSISSVVQDAKTVLSTMLAAELTRRGAIVGLTLPAPVALFIALDDNIWQRQYPFPSIVLVVPNETRRDSSGNQQECEIDLVACVILSAGSLGASTEEQAAIGSLEYGEAVMMVLSSVLPLRQVDNGVTVCSNVGSVGMRPYRYNNAGPWITARKAAVRVTARLPSSLP